MKSLFFTLTFVWTCVSAWSQGVLLGPGESYTLQFSSLSYLWAAPPTQIDVGGLVVWFPSDGFAGGETVQVNRFRDTLADTPISSVITLPTPPSDTNAVIGIPLSWPNDQPFWTDMQGVVCVTGISGNVRLGGVSVHELINGGVYGAFLAVPEPSILSLLLLGTGCLAARTLRRNHAANFSLEPTAASPSACGGAGRYAAPVLPRQSASGGSGSVAR